jgi:hypothetical protein
MTDASADKKADAEANIEISLSQLSQLFNLFDPSPFHERDLDPDAGRKYHRIGRGRGAPHAAVSRGAFASESATKLGRYRSRPVNP